MSAHNSLTVVLRVRDAASCQLELAQQRAALEHGFARVPGLSRACLALLPAAHSQSIALLFQCSFETPFADLMFVSFQALGRELSAVFRHCAEYPEAPNVRNFAEYLGSRARRSAAFRAPGSPADELDLRSRLWRVLDGSCLQRRQTVPELSEAELSARRVAVGMQEPIPGVPLLHLGWLSPENRARVKRALRELELEPAPLDDDARFLIDDARLVFLAYPSENAQRWSERLSQAALAPCARVWRNCSNFPRLFGLRRLRRERRLQEFVLEHRLPVAVWFNARHPRRDTPHEY